MFFKMTDISNIYNKMLSNGKKDYERVGWGSLESQEKRFHILTKIGDLNNCSILDVGCGLGSYFEYVNAIFEKVLYTGTDINSKMISEAQLRYTETEFVHTDITSSSHSLSGRKFDYIFLSGALNLSEDGHNKIIKSVMNTMFEMANKGIAINFLSIFSDYISPGEFYCNPIDMIEVAFSLSRKVTLRRDYMPHDFTIYMYK